MGLTNRLAHSKFLTNIARELQCAREVIRSAHYTTYVPQLIADKKLKKQIYEECLYYYDLSTEMQETLDQGIDADSTYCIQYDHIVFMYALSSKQLKETMQYTYNLNGDFPFYRARHRINNKTVFAALYDTRITFMPASPN